MKVPKNRVIVFDILRIVAISLIVISHIALISNYEGFFSLVKWSMGFRNYFYFDIGIIGVLIFLFISGSVLEMNKSRINSISSYVRFEIHRLLRIYPAYWMSLLFAVFLFLFSGNHNVGDLFWQFSGFSAFVFQWGGILNPVGWCIGLFVVLYLLYPFISLSINRNPWITLACLFIISAISTYYMNITFPIYYGISRWVPLCNLIYFGLGIFIVRKSWYPKYPDKTGFVSYFGELSFYVFLFHLPILNLVISAGIPAFLVCTIVLSMIAMFVDSKIQEYLKQAGQWLTDYWVLHSL